MVLKDGELIVDATAVVNPRGINLGALLCVLH
jgi:hypothetical protein